MTFDLDRFSTRTTKLDISDIDFASFETNPLPTSVLRCLHDVEHHTVCYLRDLLVTRAHREPDVTTFLTIWNYEEHWHGEAIGQVLSRHGEVANAPRVDTLRRNLGVRDHLRPILCQVGSLLTRHVVAVHMTWGAINEWTTQAAYARLMKRARHPVLDQLLARIMRQEGQHIEFYMAQAEKRLGTSPTAQRLARRLLQAFWAPVGSGIMPNDDVRFLISYLFGDQDGVAAADRIDRRLDRLPGLEGLALMHRAVEEFGFAN